VATAPRLADALSAAVAADGETAAELLWLLVVELLSVLLAELLSLPLALQLLPVWMPVLLLLLGLLLQSLISYAPPRPPTYVFAVLASAL
jgi:hypothetical protein